VVRRPPAPGQLTLWWRVATAATWVLVIAAFIGVWNTSRQLGVALWWLGPDGEPQPFFITLLPFVSPLVMIVLALNNVRHLPWFGLAAAAVTSVFGFIDLGYVRRLGVVELVVAGAGAAVAIAGFGGTYARSDAAEPIPAVTAPAPAGPAGMDEPPPIADSPG
jgi:hypothetical protein